MRSRAKKEQEMRDFQHQLTKNMKLRSANDKKADTIIKLRAYYIKCLQSKKYYCVDKHGADKSPDAPASALSSTLLPSTIMPSSVDCEVETCSDISTASSNFPMVTIKSEGAELLIPSIKAELEDD